MYTIYPILILGIYEVLILQQIFFIISKSRLWFYVTWTAGVDGAVPEVAAGLMDLPVVRIQQQLTRLVYNKK